MTDLAYTQEEMDKNSPKCCDTSEEYKGPKYPWGLMLCFDNDTLAKLGLDATKFSVGQKVPMTVIATVTQLSLSEDESGKRQSMNLVAGDIELSGEKKKTESELAAAMFGKKS